MSNTGRYTLGTGAAPLETATGNSGGAVGPASSVGGTTSTDTAALLWVDERKMFKGYDIRRINT